MPDSLESVGGAGGGGGGCMHLASVAGDEDAEVLAGANGQGQEFQEREGQEREMLLIGTQFRHLYTGQGQEFLDLNCYADPSPPQLSAQGTYWGSVYVCIIRMYVYTYIRMYVCTYRAHGTAWAMGSAAHQCPRRAASSHHTTP